MFALVDCDNFYVSCERIFKPGINYSPIIVLSNNDGCVISRSNEAKSLGLKMGEPYFMVKDFCKKHKVHVFSSNYELYGDISSRIISILREDFDKTEEYSIDEAFLEVELFDSAEDYFSIGSNLQKKILNNIGIPVSIGFGSTKVLAKVANQIAKKKTQENVYVIKSRIDLKRILSSYPVGDVWGIGNRIEKNLKSMGILTAWELCNSSSKYMRGLFNVTLEKIMMELQGVSCIALGKDTDRKNISCSRSFSEPLSDKSLIVQALSSYVSRASEKLRMQNGSIKELVVFLVPGNQSRKHTPTKSILCNISNYSNDTRIIISSAIRGLEKIYEKNIFYKKVGVVLKGIKNVKFSQVDLFSPSGSVEESKLMETFDEINKRMGKGSVFICSEGVAKEGGLSKKWIPKSDYCSPRYTTRWDEILLINLSV